MRALFLALAGCLAFGAGAPPMPQGRYTFRSYGSEQGLKNLSPQCLLQDRRGLLWVGTEDGLYRYDSHRFQAFTAADGLPSSFVTDMDEDREGRLWLGTYQGLAVREQSRFRVLGPEQGLGNERVVDLCVGEDQVWVAMGGGPKAVGLDGRPLPLPPWPGGEASALWCGSSQDHGWAARWVESGPGQGAQVLELRQGAWVPWAEPSGFGHERLDAVLQDRTGTVWARGAHHLWSRAPGDTAFHEALPGIPATSVKATLRLGHDGTLYVPTYQGIRYFQRGEWRSLDAQAGLPTEWAQDVLEDSEGSLWVASLGVHRLLGRGLWRAYTQRDGLPNDVIWTIFRNREHQFFVGTDQGLAMAGPRTWPLVPGTEGRAIRTVVEAPDGTLYMSGVPAEVLRWDPRSRRVVGRAGRESGLRGKRVFRLVLDAAGILWAATDDAGLQRADTHAKELRFEPVALPGGTSTEFTTGLTIGGSGRLYVSGQGGLAVLDHGAWRRYTKADGLLHTHVAYALELKDGDLLVAYFESGGFSRVHFQPGGGLLVQPPPDPGGQLGREKVYMMGEDSQGRIWVGTGQGVFILHGEDVQRFGLADGMVGEDVDNMAFMADPGGDTWVGTSAGLARFDASSYHGPAAAPATALMECSLGGKPQLLTGGESQVPFRQGTLEARFAGLSFLGEGLVQYGIRLRGLEEDWHVTETQEARYPALAAGSYTLEVRSRVAQGPWGEPATFAFEVLPAWWQTWWFRLLGLGALVAGIVGIIRWRLAALRHQAEALQELVHQRTAELEIANETLRNQSLTDPLTGLRNRRYLATRLPEDVAQVQRLHHELRRKDDTARMNKDLVFLMVDLDHFKQVNDTYGHAAGDQVLLQVSELLRLCIRESDFVVRWGGEEFLVVARNANREEAPVMAERIRIAVGEHEFDLGEGHTIRRTCSIGFAPVPFLAAEPDLLHWEQVVDLADHCLYTAKRSGRDAWVGVLASETFRRESSADLAHQMAQFIRDGALKVETSKPDPESLIWE
ncbi:MAG TPA: diguanylate cyclase [Holophagaceae bacterium]|nr:diguanylate cyclase [Holophagaceae bacterium]